MTFRERILRTFQHRPVDRIVWQPRIYYWYNGRRDTDTVPEYYRGMSMLQVYDDLGASPRYPPEVLDLHLFRTRTDDTVVHHTRQEGRDVITIHETPLGSLREVVRKCQEGTGGYQTEYPLKTPADMEVMKYILDHTEFYFDREAFEEAEKAFGPRGVTQTFYARSPYQRLAISYMGLESAVYALTDYRKETEAFLKACDESDDAMYRVVCDSPVQILNFGENIDANVASPRYFERYLLPYYRKRVEQVHASGKFCHIHMDGSLKALLPFINQAGFDGIEGATPLPQGDVTLEELKEAMGETILLDGIPAILFLPRCSDEEVAGFATRVLDLFAPNLILGVSDELPPPADIEKVRLISELVANYELPTGQSVVSSQ